MKPEKFREKLNKILRRISFETEFAPSVDSR